MTNAKAKRKIEIAIDKIMDLMGDYRVTDYQAEKIARVLDLLNNLHLSIEG